jgi:putative phage-type endonuclease
MDVYLEKIGSSAPLVETERMHWGKALEDVVAKEYARETGRKVRKSNLTLRVESAEWRMAHIDRAVISTDGIRRGLEVKTADRFASSDFGEPGSDQVPPDYHLQCDHYLGVTGWDVWDLAVLIGGNHFAIYTIPRDEKLISDLFEIEDDFWQNNVIPRIPPPIDGSEASRRFLEAGHVAPDEELPMTDALYELALAYESLRLGIKDSTTELELTKNKIREAMGAAGKSRRDNAQVSWSITHPKRVNLDALRTAHPAIVEEFTAESEEHRLTVSVKESSS